MKVSAFEKILRKVVREEINYALKHEISMLKEELSTATPQQQVVNEENNPQSKQELENFRAKLRAQMPPPNFNTGDNTLNNLLAETAQQPSPEEVFSANDPVNQFLNKDYTEIMQAIDKKKDYRP